MDERNRSGLLWEWEEKEAIRGFSNEMSGTRKRWGICTAIPWELVKEEVVPGYRKN